MTYFNLTLHRDPAGYNAYDSVVYGGKRYYALEPGEQYYVKVTMPFQIQSARREVLLSIDGRDTMKNEPADFNKFRGLVTSEGSIIFKGWRTSSEEVRAFIAESLGYGLTTSEKNGGAASARGTIGAAVFFEERAYVAEPKTWQRRTFLSSPSNGHMMKGGSPGYESFMSRGIGSDNDGPSLESMSAPTRGGGPAHHTDVYSYSMSVPAPVSAPVVAPSVGTKAGHVIFDRVGTTSFVRKLRSFGQPELPQLLEIEYDSKANLIQRGIWPAPQSTLPIATKAWAGMPVAPQFCDPRRL